WGAPRPDVGARAAAWRPGWPCRRSVGRPWDGSCLGEVEDNNDSHLLVKWRCPLRAVAVGARDIAGTAGPGRMCRMNRATFPACTPRPFGPEPRRSTRTVDVGGVTVGGGAPVVVQSMTNTDTTDVESTARQIAELWRAGSEMVRITVNTPEAAAAVPRIVDRLAMQGVEVPVIGDFHYNGHQLLADEPACAEALAKYRINPGNVGFGKKK